jgi:hypothetical protein
MAGQEGPAEGHFGRGPGGRRAFVGQPVREGPDHDLVCRQPVTARQHDAEQLQC